MKNVPLKFLVWTLLYVKHTPVYASIHRSLLALICSTNMSPQQYRNVWVQLFFSVIFLIWLHDEIFFIYAQKNLYTYRFNSSNCVRKRSISEISTRGRRRWEWATTPRLRTSVIVMQRALAVVQSVGWRAKVSLLARLTCLGWLGRSTLTSRW